MNNVSERTEKSPSTQAKSDYFIVISVRFRDAGTPYHFLVDPDMGLEPENWIVVETIRGLQVGQVVEVGCDLPKGLNVRDLRRVIRLATGLDMARYQYLKKRAERLVDIAQDELAPLKAKDVKPISGEYTLDRRKAIIYYKGKLPHEKMVTWQNKLAERLQCVVELHSVGPRDEAKFLEGYGVCGARRCCARFLTDFKPISIHMAKDQAISLAPTDITGMCGRLRCCLDYEHQVYIEASKGFPRRKSHVETPKGVGRVIDWDVLKELIVVEIPPYGPRRERQRHRFPVDEVKVVPKKKRR
jgi:cell fate regulator YaaT (PSP1 superfamily)